MDILNVQSLIAQGLITDVASVDPNKAYVAVGVFQPGNRQAGAAGNAYPSYAMPISEFLAGIAYTASNGIALVGNDFQLASLNISQFTNDSGYITSSALTGYVQGNGSIGYVPRWDLTDTLGNSIIFDDGLGKIGIGTITPAEKLNVVGTVRTDFTALGYTPAYTIFNNGAAAAEFGYNTTYGAIVNANSGILALNPVSGNVGIGTTFSNAKLSFGGFYNTTGTPTSNEQTSHIKLYEGGGSYYGFGMSYNTKAVLTIAANSNVGNIGFYTNSLQRALIDENGNFGIGTASPTALLNVAGSFIVDGKINTNTNIISTSGVDTINWASCELKFNTSIGLNWYSRLLKDTANNNTLKWSNEIRVKSYLNPVADLMGDDADLRILGDPTGTAGNGLYFKATNSVAIWRTTLKILNNGSGEPFVNIIGSDATSANYSLKVDNSASTNLLSIANNGVAIFNSILDGSGGGVDNYKYSSTTGGVQVSYNSFSGASIANYSTNGSIGTAINEVSGFYQIASTNRISLKTKSDEKTHLYMGSDGQIGIGGDFFTTSASLHVQGIDSTSSNYALKVDNSASSPLLYVRNDGYITNSSISDTTSFYISNKISGDNTLKVQSDSAGRGFVVTENANINTGNAIQLVVSNTGLRSIRGLSNNAGAVISNLNIETIGLGVGSSIFSASAMIHIQGIDSTSSNYALKVDNFASSPLLYVNNAGNIGIGIAPTLADVKLEIKVATNQRFLFINSTYPSIGAALTLQAINDATTDVVNVVTLGLDWYHASRNNLFSNATNTIIPTAKVHIIGNNQGSDLYALKVDNLGLNPLFYVRNDGLLSAPSMPTSNAGLTPGDMYVDTAANILANGDKVVGWKV